jgi:hypothetical protein
MNAKAALLIVAALTLSERAEAQDTRPVRFWINVTDFALPEDQRRLIPLIPDSPIPARLVGWTCKTSPVTTISTPASQSADVVCTSKSGTVKASAKCALSASDQFDKGELRITDVVGHEVWVGVACRN